MNTNILFNNISQYWYWYYISKTNNKILFQFSKDWKIDDEFILEESIVIDEIINVDRVAWSDESAIYIIITNEVVYLIDSDWYIYSQSKYDYDSKTILSIMKGGVLKVIPNSNKQLFITNISDNLDQNVFDLFSWINLNDTLYLELWEYIEIWIVEKINLDVEYHLNILKYNAYYAKPDKCQEFIVINEEIYYSTYDTLINITEEYAYFRNLFFDILDNYNKAAIVKLKYINAEKEFTFVLEDNKEITLYYIDLKTLSYGFTILSDEDKKVNSILYKVWIDDNNLVEIFNNKDTSIFVNEKIKKNLIISDFKIDMNHVLSYNIVDEEFVFQYVDHYNYKFRTEKELQQIIYDIIMNMSKYRLWWENEKRLDEIKKYIKKNKENIIFTLSNSQYNYNIFIENIKDNSINVLYLRKGNDDYWEDSLIYLYQDVFLWNKVDNLQEYSFIKSKYNNNLTILKDWTLLWVKAIDMDTIYFYWEDNILNEDNMSELHESEWKDISTNIINMADDSQVVLLSYYQHTNPYKWWVMQKALYMNKLVAIKIVDNEVIEILTEQDLIDKWMLDIEYSKNKENKYNHYIMNSIALWEVEKKFFWKNNYNFRENITSKPIWDDIDAIFFWNTSYKPEETYIGYNIFNQKEFITDNESIIEDTEYSEILYFTNTNKVLYVS